MSQKQVNTIMSSGISRKRSRSCISAHNCFNLSDLFGSFQPNENSQKKCKTPSRDSLKESQFCTFRMEQRSGGNLAQHHGEERVLIFCSSQRGAIAKIVFSSEGTSENSDNSMRQKSAHAKIHSLSVKEAFRGYGLGSILFLQAMESLRDRYLRELNDTGSPRKTIHSMITSECTSPHVECCLDAEEDVRRHHKLVNFYEGCGCHVKPNAKISYINNNDGETYRKVPMHIILMPEASQTTPSRYLWTKFSPVDFFSTRHQRAQLTTEPKPLDWFVVELDETTFEFRSTNGHLLSVANDEYCRAVNGNSTPSSRFQFLQATDAPMTNKDLYCRASTGTRDLFTIESRSGQYLGIDPVHINFTCSETPSFWHTGDCKRSLICVKDSPARRQHCEYLRTVQSVDYVLQKQERYLHFNLVRLSLKDALDLAGGAKANGFGEEICDRSLRGLLYTTAEQSRRAGFPDWFQLIALIHGLAGILGSIAPDIAKETIEEGYDWTLCSHSGFIRSNEGRVLDLSFPCKSCNRSVHKTSDRSEARELVSMDESGISIAPLWTGPEYLYNMLNHNGVDLPEEAFVVLRLFPIDESEREECSKAMTEIVDHDALCIVQDFCDILETARHTVFSTEELHEKACSSLWDVHYSRIFEKYGADKVLRW